MKISIEAIKELRNLTSVSIADCRKALEESGGDMPKAIELLRRRGMELAVKKQDSVAKEGRIEVYAHLGNKIGVLLEVNCQTDFAARNSDFCQFTKDMAMQITACNPLYLKREDVPPKVLEQEKDKEQFLKNNCLLEQLFIRDPNITVKEYLTSLVVKLGENIIIRRFIRYKVGE